MAIVRWDPFREFAQLQDQINRAFTNAYGGSGASEDSLMTSGAWGPLADIFHNGDQERRLKAELPDMKREDIDLTVDNGTLTIRGEKKFEADVKEENYHRIERRYGTFSRSFSLPPTVDAVKVVAEYKNGVLTVRLPLREEAKPRQIKVNVAA